MKIYPKVLLQPQLSKPRGDPRSASLHFLKVNYSSLEAALSFAPTFRLLGWSKWALPVDSSTQVPIFGPSRSLKSLQNQPNWMVLGSK